VGVIGKAERQDLVQRRTLAFGELVPICKSMR
jgi:hypothetical protein